MLSRGRPAWRAVLLFLVLGLCSLGSNAGASRRPAKAKPREDRMSAMGRLARDPARLARIVSSAQQATGRAAAAALSGTATTADAAGDNDDLALAVAGGQAETAMAADSTGAHVVIGFNDTRGFSLSPVSVSGFAYSDDGGVTFTDGGQLPVTSGSGEILPVAAGFPQVFGDPEIKYLGACNFVYVSIVVLARDFDGPGPMGLAAAQTLGFHRSTDCGHTWKGPFEMTSATNPNGLFSGSSPRDAADKEFMDIDPDTGRALLSWSNFTPVALGGVEISTTFSDDILTGTPPTWSTRAVVGNRAIDGQSSVPRFAGNGSPNAYVVWRTFSSFYFGGIGFSRSIDNGATWSIPAQLNGGADFFFPDQVLGNDRVNHSPSLAVDTSGGANRGNVYVVYADNDNGDGSDIAFQKSTDGGVTFSATKLLNSRPGSDRAQWFPWITVDQTTGRLYVHYLDQGIAANGDLTEATFLFSGSAGDGWRAPQPLTDRPFHAGWGNDTGQPNLGDYNQAVAQNGDYFVVYGEASKPPAGFTDGEPGSASFTVPDFIFRRVSPSGANLLRPFTVALGTPSFTDANLAVPARNANGNIDPGDTVSLTLPITNYDTNPLSSKTFTTIHGFLTTTTPGVGITVQGNTLARAEYGTLAAGASGVNSKPFLLSIGTGFVPGTPIDLRLDAKSNTFPIPALKFTLFTGTPSPTTIFSESFEGVTPPALPAGWAAVHVTGTNSATNTVPWTTRDTGASPFGSACSGSKAAFHVNANDGASPLFNPRRFERLFSPGGAGLIVVPASDYVTLDFDICTDTEEDPNYNVQAYDGFTIRITDFTSGRILRSVLPEAFEDTLTTGTTQHYPRHLPRSAGSAAYFQDMSVWAGNSGGWKHVSMRLPGMAGSTVQLRFEFTQDTGGICSDIRPAVATCGVAVDNIVMQAVTNIAP